MSNRKSKKYFSHVVILLLFLVYVYLFQKLSILGSWED